MISMIPILDGMTRSLSLIARPVRSAGVISVMVFVGLMPVARPALATDFTSLQWGNAAIHVPEAWQLVPGRGAGVTVCDVDSGIMLTHPDLQSAIVGGSNTSDATTPSSFADDGGHGTFTAGIMVARGADVWGVAPGASLLVAKAITQGSGDSTSVTAGILWCVAQGAHVVNLSLGAPAKTWDGFREAVAFGCRHGVDFAVAAGNNSTPHEPLNPAKVESPCLVTVNASDRHDGLAEFSNFYENQRTITAPGQVIVSDWTNGSVALGSGTSASAPFVAGVLALLRSQGADAKTAVNVVLASARHPKGVDFSHGRNRLLGRGILDAAAACRAYARVHTGHPSP
jgi:thermitase